MRQKPVLQVLPVLPESGPQPLELEPQEQ